MGVLSWILLAACMLWSALRFLPAGREAHMPTMPYMIALIRFLWIPYLVIAVWAGLVGSWWQCGVAVAGIVSILAMQVPYWTNMPRERWHHQRGTSHETASDDYRQTARSADAEPTANPPQASGDTYHLMTLNCRYGKASADAIIAAVRERHIDVLALQELSTDLIKRLERGGLHRILPYRQLGTPREKTDNGGFNGIWSRTKPKRGTHGIVSIPAADVPGIMLQTDDGTSVAFASAHTKSPMRGCREWSDGIRSLSALVPMPRKSVSAGTGRAERATGSKGGRDGGSAYPDVDIAVLMGDLNADIDHASSPVRCRGRASSSTTSWPRRENPRQAPPPSRHEPSRSAASNHSSWKTPITSR
ncbi:endonuclease/exonuclease/phosphatase family protein [Bifidobacterium bifidum]|uniref:endonuclease/exonuclease/phosphatase family protein n=1 Tax=Bifidobacterium bifidum TaxID=1681 RepID=UPI003872F90D